MSVIESSAELWTALRLQAGLTLSGAGDGTGYDDALVDELRRDLFGDTPGTFEDLLDELSLSTARLLGGFLRALAPFARMTSDILQMFERAAARRSDENLRIRIDSELGPGELDFDLSSFRETTRRLELATRMARPLMWGPDTAWSLLGVLGDARVGQADHIVDPAMREWLGEMAGDHSFPPPPPPVRSGVADLDLMLDELWADFRSFQAAGREVFGRWRAIGGAEEDAVAPFGWSWWMLRYAGHDRWPWGTVEGLAHLAEGLRQDPTDLRLLNCVVALREQLDSMTGPLQPKEVLEEALDEILSLPVWRQRHEVYSVWIASVITGTLEPYGVEFHVQDGQLAFPFRKLHFATVGGPRGQGLELWSELRTPASDPVGRKAEVQPDYRLRFPAGEHGREADLLVVECKQYRRSSARNFSAALTDYAKAAPAATVALANYGPVGPAVMRRVAPSVARRCRAIGAVKPSAAGQAELVELILTIALGVFGAPRIGSGGDGWSITECEVELVWRGRAVDLDLHVTTPEAACGYASPRGLAEATFHGDDLGGEGEMHSERIVIRPDGSGRFDVVVCAYSGAATPGAASPEIRMRWLTGEGVWDSTAVSVSSTDSRDWHVATLMQGCDAPLIVGSPAVRFTAGRGWDPEAVGA